MVVLCNAVSLVVCALNKANTPTRQSPRQQALATKCGGSIVIASIQLVNPLRLQGVRPRFSFSSQVSSSLAVVAADAVTEDQPGLSLDHRGPDTVSADLRHVFSAEPR